MKIGQFRTWGVVWVALMLLIPAATGGWITLESVSDKKAKPKEKEDSGSQGNPAYHQKYEFSVEPEAAGAFLFRILTDLSAGGALFVDGSPVARAASEVEREKYAEAGAKVLQFTVSLAAGKHELDFYGAWGGYDVVKEGKYSQDGGKTWAALADQGRGRTIPDRGSMLGMMVLGFAGLVGWRRVVGRVRRV